jgi:release factor glutamine methyltransferase
VSFSPTDAADPAGGPGPRVDPAEVIARLRAAGCVFAEEEAALLLQAAPEPGRLWTLVARRAAGEPLEQLLGRVDFCGLGLAVDPGVFVPRQRTRLLVERALPWLRGLAGVRRPVVVDLCCGCGAVGVALATLAGPVELHAVDVDDAAVACARRNAQGVGGRVYRGDLYGPLPPRLLGAVDVLVANAPYVPTQEIAFMPPEARLHEPAVALDGGGDGLDVVRRIAADAARWLAPDGLFLVESSRRQAPAVVEALDASRLRAQLVTDDELDATAVIARRRVPGHGR